MRETEHGIRNTGYGMPKRNPGSVLCIQNGKIGYFPLTTGNFICFFNIQETVIIPAVPANKSVRSLPVKIPCTPEILLPKKDSGNNKTSILNPLSTVESTG